MSPTSADRLRTSVGRLATLLSYWTPPRFSAAASPLLADAVSALRTTTGPAGDAGDAGTGQYGSVAEQLHLVVACLADLGADAEGRPRRPVPYPDEPATLADQLTVVTLDLLAAGASSAALFDQLTGRLDALRAAL